MKISAAALFAKFSVLAIFLSALFSTGRAQTFKYSPFAPAGAQLTIPGAINQAGEITGLYHDSKKVNHAFFSVGRTLGNV